MELIMINDAKLKVMLSEEDMRFYMLDAKELDYAKSETRRAFRVILEEAKSKTGFDACCDRVFIQVFPSRGGGCELYVTKLSEEKETGGMQQDDNSMAAASPAGPRQAGALHNGSHASVYLMPDTAALTSACFALLAAGYNGESELYRSPRGTERYLLLCEAADNRLPSEFPCVREFGEKLPFFAAEEFVREHALPICEKNAVSIFAALK